MLWFFILFWVIFEVKTAEVDAELSPRITVFSGLFTFWTWFLTEVGSSSGLLS